MCKITSLQDAETAKDIHSLINDHRGQRSREIRFLVTKLHVAGSGGMGLKSYNSIVVAFCKLSLPRAAHQYFKRMNNKGYRAFPSTVTKIIESVGSKKERNLLIDIHKAVEGRIGTTPSSQIPICNALIKNYRRCDMKDSAAEVLRIMKKNGVRPTFETIQGLMINAEHWEIVSAFQRAKRLNISPTPQMMRLAILSCKGSPENIILAERLHAKLREVGIEPDATTYNALLDVYKDVNNFDKFKALLVNMSNSSIAPTIETLLSTIRICQKNTKRPSDSFELMAVAAFETAIRMNLSSKLFWTAMMITYAESGNVDAAHHLIEEYRTNVGELMFCTDRFIEAYTKATNHTNPEFEKAKIYNQKRKIHVVSNI